MLRAQKRRSNVVGTLFGKLRCGVDRVETTPRQDVVAGSERRAETPQHSEEARRRARRQANAPAPSSKQRQANAQALQLARRCSVAEAPSPARKTNNVQASEQGVGDPAGAERRGDSGARRGDKADARSLRCEAGGRAGRNGNFLIRRSLRSPAKRQVPKGTQALSPKPRPSEARARRPARKPKASGNRKGNPSVARVPGA